MEFNLNNNPTKTFILIFITLMFFVCGCAKRINYVYKIKDSSPIMESSDLTKCPFIGMSLSFAEGNGSYDDKILFSDIKNSIETAMIIFANHQMDFVDISSNIPQIVSDGTSSSVNLCEKSLASLGEKYPNIHYALILSQIGKSKIYKECSIKEKSDMDDSNKRIEKRFDTIYLIKIETALYDLKKKLLIAKASDEVTKTTSNIETEPLLGECLGWLGDLFDFFSLFQTFEKCKPEEHNHKFFDAVPVQAEDLGNYIHDFLKGIN